MSVTCTLPYNLQLSRRTPRWRMLCWLKGNNVISAKPPQYYLWSTRSLSEVFLSRSKLWGRRTTSLPVLQHSLDSAVPALRSTDFWSDPAHPHTWPLNLLDTKQKKLVKSWAVHLIPTCICNLQFHEQIHICNWKYLGDSNFSKTR